MKMFLLHYSFIIVQYDIIITERIVKTLETQNTSKTRPTVWPLNPLCLSKVPNLSSPSTLGYGYLKKKNQ